MFSALSKKISTIKRVQQVFHYAKSVRKSKEELREELESARFKVVRDALTSALKQKECLSVSEWKSLTAELNKNSLLTDRKLSVDRLIFSVLLTFRPPIDSLLNARSFIEARNLSYDLNVKTSIVKLYAKKHAEDKLTDNEEKELIELCNEFIKSDFSQFPEMHKVITHGLCATREWKKALKLLRHVSNSSLNILIRKAIRENEIAVMWELLNNLTQMSTHFQYIAPKTCVAIAKYFERNPNSIDENVESFFRICESIEIVFDEKSAHEFTRILQRSGRQAKIIKMDFSGVCSTCKNTLGTVQITANEFELVKKEFMHKVVKGSDIYQKTTPEEWQRFERLIEEHRPFDIVMDGLNVAYMANANNSISQSKSSTYGQRITMPGRVQKPCAHSLANAVQQLVDEGKRVLVLGRTHMNKWPKINNIRRIAPVFLVDNISKDDIFILYAALCSGPNTYILSNDFMRQHKHAIGKQSKQFSNLFKLWQQEHWYGFTSDENTCIKLIKPMQFKMYGHKVGDCWHLPFKSEQEIESNTWSYYELPKNWMCVRLEPSHRKQSSNM